MSCEIRSMIPSYFFGASIRTPPTFTNSASTPSTFIELIFSTKAGGNVFSIPNKIPILLVLTKISCREVACTVSSTHYQERCSNLRLDDLNSKIFPRHPHPKRPIMLRIVSPNVQPVRNRLPIQNRRELYILIQTDIPVRRSQNDLHLSI